MRFMNDFDIARAVHLYGDDPILGPAVRTLDNLRSWADDNSDGWAYWPKPARSAAKLMEMIEGTGTWQAQQDVHLRATSAAYRSAVTPIKSFLTRQGVDHSTIVVPLA